MVQRLLQLREDVFADYSEDAFAAALRAQAEVVEAEVVGRTGRKLFWYDRRR